VSGLLDVGDGNQVYWESHGDGTPALVVHGGPRSGCGPYYLEFFDMSGYCVVLVDQRNCGKSLPHASDPAQSPLGNAWILHRVWPRADLTVVDDAGPMTAGAIDAVRAATDRFSS
jgi:pimeloyl-ACP methyl ester carboxylesterase